MASEVMDDVAFAFQIEGARRAIHKSTDINEMRNLSLKILEMLGYQRVVTRQIIDQAAKAEIYRDRLHQSEEKGS